MIFVFGSNLAGIHGAGAARYAHEHEGAVWGIGEGHYGNSYAIPTKDHMIRSLRIPTIRSHVVRFLSYANNHPELVFKVTQIGCGLAGFKPEDIAPMFQDAPDNCYFDTAWRKWLGERNYWGTL